MKRVALVIGLTLLSQISWSQVSPARTKAISALKVLVDRQTAARRAMPQDLESGADISYYCTVTMFEEWGVKVFESVMNNPQAQDSNAIARYMTVRDDFSRSYLIVMGARKDLPQAVRSVNAELRKNLKLPVVPADLNFENFGSQERNYFNSLATCLDPEYVQAVKNVVVPLLEDTVIDGVAIGAADVSSETRGVLIGEVGSGDSNGRSGIVASGNAEFVSIEDVSPNYKKKQSYSEWILQVINVR